MKNVEFKELYNFSLRVNFKRVQILKIFQNPSIFTFLNKTNLKFTFQKEPCVHFHFLQWLKS